jgi:hypothetical protein
VSYSKWLIEIKGWIATAEMCAHAALASCDTYLAIFWKMGGHVVLLDAPTGGNTVPVAGPSNLAAGSNVPEEVAMDAK